MAIQFCDDFSGYGTGFVAGIPYLTNGLYAEANYAHLVEDPDPSATGIVYRCNIDGVTADRLRRVFRSSQNAAGMAFRLWLNALPSQAVSTPQFAFADATNVRPFYVTIGTVGQIIVRDGNNFNTILGQTAGPVVTANAWHHIEILSSAGAGGSCVIRVNGIERLSITGMLNVAEYSQWLVRGSATGSGISAFLKDLVVYDTSGTQNNTFLGTVAVLGRTPDSDVTLGGWTTSTGSVGWDLINNLPPKDSTDYISADDGPPAECEFGLTPLPEDITSVRAMITQVRARKTDGGDGNLQVSLKSAGSEDPGANRPITSAYTYFEDVSELDPSTSSPWTPVTAEAATVIINRTV